MSGFTSHQEYEALFNNAAIGIITVDRIGDIVMVNDFALGQFGYEADELLGKKIEVLIPERFSHRHEQHRNKYWNNNPHSRPMGMGMDLHAVKKDGTEFPVEVSLSTYKTDEGSFAIAFISDITIRKDSEQALVALNAKLEQKVKERTKSLAEALAKEKELNELKSRFVSMASHEFRTPLSTITSSVYLIERYDTTEDQPKREKHIRRIISSANMLSDILNDFLSVGKIEEGRIQVRMTDIETDSYIKSIIAELDELRKTGQQIVYTHEGEKTARLDATLLKHIIINLLSNAIKFSPEDSNIYINTNRSEDKLILSVKDNGLGIPQEDKTHLFDRFFRASNVTNIQGTGLGLHIVAKYTELMDGMIECNTQLNKGTEFIITFKQESSL